MYTGNGGDCYQSQKQSYELTVNALKANHLAQVMSNPEYNKNGNQSYETCYKPI